MTPVGSSAPKASGTVLVGPAPDAAAPLPVRAHDAAAALEDALVDAAAALHAARAAGEAHDQALAVPARRQPAGHTQGRQGSAIDVLGGLGDLVEREHERVRPVLAEIGVGD